MKIIVLILLTILFSHYGYGQTSAAQKQTKTDSYDPELAKKLGADEYGMKSYVFVVLKPGKTEIKDVKERENLLTGHLKNIVRLAEERKLVLAGPFENNKEMSGIYIFDVRTIEEARKLVETDPAIKGGLFVVEFHSWYASAAILELSQIHKKIQKKNIIE